MLDIRQKINSDMVEGVVCLVEAMSRGVVLHEYDLRDLIKGNGLNPAEEDKAFKVYTARNLVKLDMGGK